VSYSLSEQSMYKVSMLCDMNGLLELPTEIPPRTINADFSNNKISSLEPLFHYNGLQRMILRNNSISSLQGLGSSWAKENEPDN